MKKFLIINIFGIGDVLFTTPLVRNIKKNIPDAFIGYICNKRALAVLENNPHINKLYIYEKDDYRKLYRYSKIQFFKEIHKTLKGIKGEGFDVVIDLSLNRYMSFFMKMINIPERVGFNYKNRSPFLTDSVKMAGYENKHVVEYYLEMLRRLDLNIIDEQLEIFHKEKDIAWARNILIENKINQSDLLVGIIPGGGASWGPDARYRRWAPENHAKLADKIVEKFGAKVILLGDSQEVEIGERLVQAAESDIVSLIGKTSVGQYLALLSLCQFVVLNDGGPLHMAVAAGTKTVSLIGPVDENVYGPYPPEGHAVVTSDIACRPCYRQFRRADCDHIGCLNNITIPQVFEKVEELLNNK